MPTVTSFDREKQEVEALLASGIFNRAPNLAHLLKYVCAKYFEGEAAGIKEYNIAVEALGRPAEFDQKRDSIVRVEAHRLRKRLREYYEQEGASHEIHIDIPSGQYTPRFVFAVPDALPPIEQAQPPSGEITLITDAPPADIQPTQLTTIAEANPVPAKRKADFTVAPVRGRLWMAVSLSILAATAALIFFVETERGHPQARTAEPAAAHDSSTDIRILAGGESGNYVDAFEHTWQTDRYYSGGFVTQTPRLHPILGTHDQRIYQMRREGGFKYDIPLASGTYELKLYFAETVFGDNNVAGGGETTRMFSVSLNGHPLLREFDVINDAGPAVADVKVFKNLSPAPDGKMHLEFSPETNAAFVNGIELIRTEPGKLPPIRMVARDRGIKDSQNRYWEPDRYAQGGQLIARPESAVAGPEPEFYRSERFGNLNYTIPVPQPGRYGVTLYFAENWFGPGNPGGGGVGSRIFDILINGVAVRRNFDIFREAGGLGRAATVALHGVEPNHQGKIVIALTPARNYASINALEIVDESR